MDYFKAIIILLAGCLALIWGWAGDLKADQTPSLTVHFEPGKIRLSKTDIAGLHEFIESYTMGPQGRVFVVGYTDATGSESGNRKLSLQRAQSVRQAIVSNSGLDAGKVIALGKGARMPMADNKSAKGKALNRRVEIYMVNGQPRKPEPAFGPETLHWSEITQTVREAEMLIKARRIADALQLLKKAHAMGADRYSQWHAALGIAGYYADPSVEQSRAHLAAALDLDPYNAAAREYLSRADARTKVARSLVTKDMGHSAETAIMITHMAQQYEYLHLFEVEPRAHQVLESQRLDLWQCVDRQGAPVDYYFNRARLYRWALAESAAPAMPVVESDTPFHDQDRLPPVDAGLSLSPGDGPPVRGGKIVSGKIWESKLFK